MRKRCFYLQLIAVLVHGLIMPPKTTKTSHLFALIDVDEEFLRLGFVKEGDRFAKQDFLGSLPQVFRDASTKLIETGKGSDNPTVLRDAQRLSSEVLDSLPRIDKTAIFSSLDESKQKILKALGTFKDLDTESAKMVGAGEGLKDSVTFDDWSALFNNILKMDDKTFLTFSDEIKSQLVKIAESFRGVSLGSMNDAGKESFSNAHIDFPYIWSTAESLAASYYTMPVVTACVFIAVLLGFGQDDSLVINTYDGKLTGYDFQTADRFYGSRPLFVLRRLMKLTSITSAFNLKLLLDWRLGNLDKNEPERAKEALELATQMGPTFIKLGQALSIRTDLISKGYALELRKLQDAVPPFDSCVAKEMVKDELGVPNLDSVFKTISDKPIASASIGQVYRATLRDGRDVAVKVQRPNIYSAITLDLYILRLLAPLQVKINNAIRKRPTVQADVDATLSLVDEWGRGFVAELDYELEAKNTKAFAAAMKERGLGAVTAPAVVDEFSGRKVIVTEWMEGTRLDIDKSPDVPRLCGVANNAYLTMLLDTGILHCDPHPGNLLRTKDGRLCILDWGMTLEVPKDLQYSLLEYISHINTENFEAIPQDFVNLGFTPPNKLDELKRSGLTKALSFLLRQLSQGGGPSKIRDRVLTEFREKYGVDLSDEELRLKARAEMVEQMEQQLKEEGVNVSGVADVMEKMSERNRELFKIPPYVLYVSRAFSTLEGIGLSIDPNYSILQECYPYLAKRLFSDNSPRAKEALRGMIFGAAQSSAPEDKGLPRLSRSIAKLVDMSDGFMSYTTVTSTADEGSLGAKRAQQELLNLVLAPEGSFVQDIAIESAANITDVFIRGGIYVVRGALPVESLKSLLKGPRDLAYSYVPRALQPLLLPLTLPYEVIDAVDTLTAQSDEDIVTMQSLGQLRNQIQTRLSTRSVSQNKETSSSSSSDNDFAAVLVRTVRTELTNPESSLIASITDPKERRKVADSASALSRKFGASLLRRAADRAEQRVGTIVSSVSDKHRGSDNSKSGLSTDITTHDDRSAEVLEVLGRVASTVARNAAEALAPSGPTYS